jgi:DNA-binding response OmpR family regulator
MLKRRYKGKEIVKKRVKILVIEDDKPLAQMLLIMLARAGCETQVVHTGEEGMRLAFANRFDLIILDIDLPDINGLEICKQIKERHFSRHATVVLMSGRVCEQDMQRGFDLGAVDYIAKPFGVEFVPRLFSSINAQRFGKEAVFESNL